jgi:hypothetical protein
MSFVKDYACPLPVLFTGFSRLLLSRITPVLYRFSVFGFRTGFRLPNRKAHHQNRVVSRPCFTSSGDYQSRNSPTDSAEEAFFLSFFSTQGLCLSFLSFLFFPLKDYACPFFFAFDYKDYACPFFSFFRLCLSFLSSFFFLSAL